MSDNHIVKIDLRHARQSASLRRLPGLEVAEEADAVWLRAPADDETLNRLLRALPGQRFRLIDGDQLVPWGKRVPTERLPRLDWRPLAEWSAIALPVAALPAPITSRVALQLVRGGPEQPPAALLADWQEWSSYATGAAEVRLRPLAFALSGPQESVQRAFIIGNPLPPLAGRPYTVADGIAVPCGWTFSPAVGGGVIRKLVALAKGDVALFDVDGTFERIAAEHFVPAGRGAVRESARGASHV